MGTSVRLRKFPPDYEEHVYAGVLGLTMGINLGRRQGGSQRLTPKRELGRIGYDLNPRGDNLECCQDDRLACALTAVRMLEDFAHFPTLGTEHAAWTFMNYAVEGRTTLWWGGMGRSAPHSAYLRLKRGIAPCECGSGAANGSLVAEQAGGEMIGPCFGLVLPGDPMRASELAGKCARVFYDGEGVCAAQASAAFVAAAFSAKNSCALFDAALRALPVQSAVGGLIADVHAWSAANSAWEHTRELIHEKYSPQFSEGNAAPHFAGVALALAHGSASMRGALEIAALSGWGDPATLSVTACVMGALHGMLEIETVPFWVGALNDRIYCPGADAGRCITDAATEACSLVRVARGLQNMPFVAPKKNVRCHFELPGSTHSFAVEQSSESPGLALVRNIEGHSRTGKRCLAIEYNLPAPRGTQILSEPPLQAVARVATSVFMHESPPGSSEFSHGRRAADICGSPSLYAGQTLRAFIEAGETNAGETGVRPFVRYFGDEDHPTILRGPEKILLPGACHEFKWVLPNGLLTSSASDTIRLARGEPKPERVSILAGCPILEAGLEIFGNAQAKQSSGLLYLDFFTWDGSPRVDLGAPRHMGSAWHKAWVNAATRCEFGTGVHSYRISQEEAIGMLIQGSRDWRDYSVTADVTPLMARAAGVALRVQGLRRYYALLLFPDKKIRLIKQFYGPIIMAEADAEWHFGETIELHLSAEGPRLQARMDGRMIFDLTDPQQPLDGGAVALVVEEGCMESGPVRVE